MYFFVSNQRNRNDICVVFIEVITVNKDRKKINFFLKKTNFAPLAVYLQETLLLFRQLLAYHDPPLAGHLISIGFQPDLYVTVIMRMFLLAINCVGMFVCIDMRYRGSWRCSHTSCHSTRSTQFGTLCSSTVVKYVYIYLFKNKKRFLWKMQNIDATSYIDCCCCHKYITFIITTGLLINFFFFSFCFKSLFIFCYSGIDCSW